MSVGLETYRCAVGQFAVIFTNMMTKKLLKTAKNVGSREVFSGKVYDGVDITVFVGWCILSAMILFCAPFCLHMAICGDVFEPKISMYDNFISSVSVSELNDLCYHPVLNIHVSPWSSMTLFRLNLSSFHPPPNLKFLLLLCGDIERNPGPTYSHDAVKSLEAKVDCQGARLEAKLNKLIEMMDTTQSHYDQLDHKLVNLEKKLDINNKDVKSHISLLENKVLNLEDHFKENQEQFDLIREDQQTLTSRLKQLEISVEKQERYSRRSNLILFGMQEERGETATDCSSKVIQYLNRYFPQNTWEDTEHIERSHRLGRFSNSSNHPRPVIVRFCRWRNAMAIMRDREGRNNMQKGEKIRMSSDLTRVQRDTISHFRDQGKWAYYANGKLVVKESRMYPSSSQSINTAQPPTDVPLCEDGPASYAEAAVGVQGPVYTGQNPDVGVAQTCVASSMDSVDSHSHDGITALRMSEEETQSNSPKSCPPLNCDPRSSPYPRGFGRGSPSPRTSYERKAAVANQGSGTGKGRGKGKLESSQQRRVKTVGRSQSSPVLTRSQSDNKTNTSVSAHQSKLPSDWHQHNSENSKTDDVSQNEI